LGGSAKIRPSFSYFNKKYKFKYFQAIKGSHFLGCHKDELKLDKHMLVTSCDKITAFIRFFFRPPINAPTKLRFSALEPELVPKI